jgi:hypothetical protein
MRHDLQSELVDHLMNTRTPWLASLTSLQTGSGMRFGFAGWRLKNIELRFGEIFIGCIIFAFDSGACYDRHYRD